MEDNRQNVDNHLIVNGADVVDQRCLGDDMFILFLTYLGYKVTTDLSSMFVSEIRMQSAIRCRHNLESTEMPQSNK